MIPVRLLTILEWADERSAGMPCAERDRWLAESPDAPRQWSLVTEALRNLDNGCGPTGVEQLSAEQVAEYLEGSLGELGVREVEKACWKSAAQMAEVASAARFQRNLSSPQASTSLHRRLLELAPTAPRNGTVAKLPVAKPLAPPEEHPTGSIEVQPISLRATPPRRQHSKLAWPNVAAALALAAGLIGVLWVDSMRRTSDPMALDPHRVQPLPPPIVDHSPEKNQPQRIPLPESSAPSQTAEVPVDGSTPRVPQSPPSPVTDRPARGMSPLESIAPAPERPAPLPLPPPAPDELAVDSVTGLLLLEETGQGVWRVGQGRHAVSASLKLASLADSFTTLKVPELGTLVFSGSAEATLTRQQDHSWLLRLDQGRLAIRNLPAGRRLQIETGGTAWTAEGLEDSSSLAVIDGPAAAKAFVPDGRVALAGVEVSPYQVAQWVDGVMQPLESPAQIRQRAASQVLDDGLEGRWLDPPNDKARREWKTLYGRLIDRLAEADDASAALDDSFGSSRDLRHAALLARWRIAAAQPQLQPQLAWDTLNDRREPVRQAAVGYLLELPQRDARTVDMGRLLRVHLDDVTTDRMVQWLAVTRANQALTTPLALELGDSLSASELAVRQVAVSLLQMHTQPLLQRARLKPPAYDAAAPVAKRSAAQREWSQIIRRVYATRGGVGIRGAQPQPVVP